MPQWRATVDTFGFEHLNRALPSTVATRARGCLPLLNCSTPASVTAKRGPAMSASSSSRSRMTAPWTAPAKQSVTWKFSGAIQRASGTPDCSAKRSPAISSGTGRATNRRGIIVEVLGHEGQQAFDDDVDAFGIGMDAVALVERAILRHAVEEERVERHVVFLGEPLVEPVELLGVFRPEIARRQHAGQPHGNAGRLEPGDDGVEVALGRGRIEAA